MPGHSKWNEIQRQKGVTKNRELAIQASRRMIAQEERPLYRPRIEPDGRLILIRILELDLVAEALTRSEVGATARDAIADCLDVPTDAFDLAVEERKDR